MPIETTKDEPTSTDLKVRIYFMIGNDKDRSISDDATFREQITVDEWQAPPPERRISLGSHEEVQGLCW